MGKPLPKVQFVHCTDDEGMALSKETCFERATEACTDTITCRGFMLADNCCAAPDSPLEQKDPMDGQPVDVVMVHDWYCTLTRVHGGKEKDGPDKYLKMGLSFFEKDPSQIMQLEIGGAEGGGADGGGCPRGPQPEEKSLSATDLGRACLACLKRQKKKHVEKKDSKSFNSMPLSKTLIMNGQERCRMHCDKLPREILQTALTDDYIK